MTSTGSLLEQVRYLLAKRSVDRRAIDRRLRDRFVTELERLAAGSSDGISLLDVGSGVGSTLEHLLDWGLPAGVFDLSLIDPDPAMVELTQARVPDLCRDHGLTAKSGTLTTFGDEWVELNVDVTCASAIEAVEANDPDVLIGMGVVDLLTPASIARLARVVESVELAYFPITFDGGTWFDPPIDDTTDDRIVERYHAHMQRREPPGTPNAGRTLLAALPDAPTIVAGSDWVVRPIDEYYPDEEATVVRHVLDLIEGALTDDPEIAAEDLMTWLATRRSQVDDGELTYVAHQLDLLTGSAVALGDS